MPLLIPHDRMSGAEGSMARYLQSRYRTSQYPHCRPTYSECAPSVKAAEGIVGQGGGGMGIYLSLAPPKMA